VLPGEDKNELFLTLILRTKEFIVPSPLREGEDEGESPE